MGVMAMSMRSTTEANPGELHVGPGQPYATIQAAINTANDGDVIQIAQGTYYENLHAGSLEATIEGGCDNSFTLMTDDPSVTVIDGNDSDRVLNIGPSSDITIRIRTLQNGRTSWVAGIRASSSSNGNISLTLANVILQDCDCTSAHGGALCLLSYDNPIVAQLENVVIRRNYAKDGGGGISIISDASTSPGTIVAHIVSSLIYDNVADREGGGIEVHSEQSSSAQVVVINSTITSNTSTDTYPGGGGVVIHDDGTGTTTAEIYNSIIYGNTANPGADVTIATTTASSSSEIHYSDIGTLSQLSGTYNSSNLISANPLFLDQANKDFHLQTASPCIDVGTTAVPDPPGLPATDIEGSPRILGVALDMGAYEWAWDPWDYDENQDSIIQKMEAIHAIQDYFSGKISKMQTIQVIMLYFG